MGVFDETEAITDSYNNTPVRAKFKDYGNLKRSEVKNKNSNQMRRD